MPDVLTPEQRHKNMSHIRSNDASIEVTLRKALWHKRDIGAGRIIGN